jgi:dihydrofolate synthase/folylpolyglutamate synthase
LALAEQTAASRGARHVRPPEERGPGVALRARGEFQRRNFALACTVVEQLRGGLDEGLVRTVAAAIEIPGRFELLDGQPPTFIDAAHNADGVAALTEALADVSGGRPVIACLAILADKDAAAMIATLAPAVDGAVCTELTGPALRGAGRPGSRAWPAKQLARLFEAAGVAAEVEPDPRRAIARTRERAATAAGIALVTGSHYLLAIAREGNCGAFGA